MNSTNSKTKSLFSLAKEARKNSYSPYSKKCVGAAVEFNDGEIYSGANVENASYGATVCAERVAIWKKTKLSPDIKIKTIVVVTDEKNPWPPCGMCLQVISEFADKNTVVYLQNLKDKKEKHLFQSLFPLSFSSKHF